MEIVFYCFMGLKLVKARKAAVFTFFKPLPTKTIQNRGQMSNQSCRSLSSCRGSGSLIGLMKKIDPDPPYRNAKLLTTFFPHKNSNDPKINYHALYEVIIYVRLTKV